MVHKWLRARSVFRTRTGRGCTCDVQRSGLWHSPAHRAGQGLEIAWSVGICPPFKRSPHSYPLKLLLRHFFLVIKVIFIAGILENQKSLMKHIKKHSGMGMLRAQGICHPSRRTWLGIPRIHKPEAHRTVRGIGGEHKQGPVSNMVEGEGRHLRLFSVLHAHCSTHPNTHRYTHKCTHAQA